MNELTAQLIEEVSVMTAQHKREKPLKVPRPNQRAEPREEGITETASGGVRAVGAAAFLQHAAARGQVGATGE